MYDLKPLAELMLFDCSVQRENKPEMKHLQLSYYNSRASVNSVEIKNIGSAG